MILAVRPQIRVETFLKFVLKNYTSLKFKFFHLPDFRDILNSVGELLMEATIRIYDRPEKIEFPNFQVKSITISNF